MFPLFDNNPTTRLPFVTVGLIVINLAVMLWLQTLPESRQQQVVVEHGFVPARIDQLRDPNVVVEVGMRAEDAPRGGRPQFDPQARVEVYRLEAVPRQVYASLFTTMFLHGGWFHVLGNMWFLWIFGNNVEDRLGSLAYAIFYLLGGLVATLCHWLSEPGSAIPVIGASGAVAAVLGAYAVTFPHARIRTLIFLVVFASIVDLPALLVLGFWFVQQLVSGLGLLRLGHIDGAAGVAFWAHAGGFVFGMAVMPLLRAVIPPPVPPGPPPAEDWRNFQAPRRDFH